MCRKGPWTEKESRRESQARTQSWNWRVRSFSSGWGGRKRHTKTFSDPEEAEAATNQGTYVSQERAMGAMVRAELGKKAGLVEGSRTFAMRDFREQGILHFVKLS